MMALIREYNMSNIYTGVVISLFDNIQLSRRGGATTPYTVPVVFANKDRLTKHLQEQQRKESSSTLYQLMVPALSISFDGMDRNFDRQTNRMLKKKLVVIDDNNVIVNWNDTAVDFNFSMILVAKNITEMMHINEFIMSTFKNGLYYVNVKTPLYDEPIKTPISLNTADITIDDNEYEYGDDRLLSTKYDITVKGILHNNVTSQNSVITQARLNVYTDLLFETLAAQYQVVAL